jgi:hypothetical protein
MKISIKPTANLLADSVTRLAFIMITLLGTANAQTVWIGSSGNGGNGTFSTASHWSPATVPSGGSTTAQFYITGTLTSLASTISVTGNRAYGITEVGLGKSVTFSLDNSSALIRTRPQILVGTDISGQTGSGAAALTFQTTHSAIRTATLGQLIVGDFTGVSGNSVTLTSANLAVENDAGNLNHDFVGYRANSGSNQMTISAGADVERYGVDVAANQSYFGNTLTVTGVNSSLTTVGTTAESRLNIGSNAFNAAMPEAAYDGAARNNQLLVQNGGSVYSNGLTIGSAENARSNSVLISGANSTLELMGATTLQIGSANSLGGNSLQISSGGLARTEGTTTISTFLLNGGFNDGSNRMTVASGGSFYSSGELNNSGLLQLASGGSMEGKDLGGNDASLDLSVLGGGRFEVAGSGLAGTVVTSLSSTATLAVGLTDPLTQLRTGPAVFDLNSEINFASGSIFEIAIFSSTEIDQVNFGLNGEFNLNGNTTLKVNLIGYTPIEGDSWTVFTGITSGISGIGTFDLSELDPSIWDTSRFNEIGGWQLSINTAVIPEPTTSALGLAFGLAVLFRRLRRNYRS